MKKFKEFAASADKKPENYRDPETGQTKTRMVPTDKKIVKTDEKKEKQLDELSPALLNRAASAAAKKAGQHKQNMNRALDRKKKTSDMFKQAKHSKTAVKQHSGLVKRNAQQSKFSQAAKNRQNNT